MEMTRFHKEEVLCPHCANEESVVIWERVHVQEDLDLKERVLKKEVQSFECANCGETTVMAEPFLYVDSEAKLVFYYCPEYRDLLEKNRSLVATMPLPAATDLLGVSASEAAAYKLRLVTNYNDLIEKIHLEDAGLEDRLMELVKLAMRTRLLDAEDKKLSEIYFLAGAGADSADSDVVSDSDLALALGDSGGSEAGLLFQVFEESSGWNTFETGLEAYDNALRLIAPTLGADRGAGWQLVDLQWALDFVSAQ